MKLTNVLALAVLAFSFQFTSAQGTSGRTGAGGLIRPNTKENVPVLNGIMKVDSLWETTKIIREDDRSLLIVHSEVPNLVFESNRAITKVEPKSSGYWEVWLPFGSHILKVDAVGFQRLEMPARSYARKRVYETKISGILKNQRSATDKGNLVLTSTPEGASIKLDGFPDFKGTTPYGFNDYASGTYMITVTKEKYDPKEVIVFIEKGKTTTENIRLAAQFGFLNFDVPDGAQVVVDNQTATLVRGRPFEVAAGIHRLAIRAGGGMSLKDTTVVVPPGETVQVRVPLR